MIFVNCKSRIFRNFKNPNGKNLDLQIKMCFAKENLPQDRTDFTETNF